jgi:hypothetical protein
MGSESSGNHRHLIDFMMLLRFDYGYKHEYGGYVLVEKEDRPPITEEDWP